MTVRRKDQWSGARILGIVIVILSVIHVPLPQADYHNVRHHDAPGEVCPHHDHLLRWHPSADSDADLSLLHWHWFLPLVEPGDHHQRPNDDHHRPGSGPALHAHVGDGLAPDDWRGEPLIQSSGFWRLIDHLVLDSSFADADPFAAALGMPSSTGNLPGRGQPAEGSRAQRTAIFQRWNC